MNRTFSVSLVTLLLGASLAGGGTVPQETTDPIAQKLAALESRYRDSLVQVRYTQRVIVSTAEPPQEEELTTTGVIVSADGLVMVSAIIYEPFTQVPHGVGIRFPASVSRVDAEVSEARVRMIDGNEFPANLLGRDPDADVAFFRIEPPEDHGAFRPVVFEAASLPSVGDQVAVLSLLPEPLGPALAVEPTRVQAITSRPRDGFMVATGAPDPVGAIVCSLEGKPLGFLDALTVPAPDNRARNPLAFLSVMRDLPKGVGRGFARPAREFADANVRVTTEKPERRGWLGVEMQALEPKLASHLGLPTKKGIILGYVYRNSPAERAGLQTGDILMTLEGEPIEVSREDDIGSFAEKVLRAGPEAELALGYFRDGERHDTTAKLQPAPRSSREAATVEVDELELVVRELTYDYLATRFLEPEQAGVVVMQPPVSVSSNPNRVAPGDLLVRMDDQPIKDLGAFREAIERIRREQPEEVVLFLERGRESFFFAVKPDWD